MVAMEDKAAIVKKLCETLQLTRRYGDIADIVYVNAEEFSGDKYRLYMKYSADDELVKIVFAGGESIDLWSYRRQSGYMLVREILKALKKWR